ncbi:antiviral innate immune response receptor RIG-I [Hyla sarda]|uniref:antiviral innate immune response receptor RIG-I n=1 Tax=Hyla sarda TaxID=327740 RepID=UPI0024C36CA3|nr:antiviral innate immune response receptor RIG-I [Hyla sarda]XP_056375521.1 antiviral innate immune response receptor RIG-I [Hyla sarda]XP_056375526.1 antiviral innate immune response receptor RIG-I [Hyla sarda]
MGAEVKESLRLYSEHIVKILRPSYVLQNMRPWMSESAIEQIKAEEAKGPIAAANMFLEKLLELDAEGWYQGFIDVLRTEGYRGLSEALQKLDFADIQSLEEPRKRLSIINSIVKSNIRTDEIIGQLADCLLQREIEEIKEETRLKGTTAGAEKLIDCLLRSDKKEWPKVFTLALQTENHFEVLNVWSTFTDCPEKTVEPVEESEEESVFTVQFVEKPILEDNLLSASPPLANGNEAAAPQVSSLSSTSRSIKDIKLRNYQKELAQPACNGKNTIICAPTGSGKTYVALNICDHHLQSLPQGQKGKIVFMATKVPVYEQQKAVFSQYFENTGYTVVGFSGEETENVPLGMIIDTNDIIILTPQILVNCLIDGSVPSLSIFTLMIFDECHNTIGHHPYNVLMFHYLDLKLGCPDPKLPQIVGLTASVGTGKSRSTGEAVSYISKLCASLDIEEISTVKQHVEELQRVVYKPEKLVYETRQRENDPFAEAINKIMAEIEQMAKKVFPHLDMMTNIHNRPYGTKQYEQWIVATQKNCHTLQLEDKIEESQICSALFVYTEHLRKFNDALIINNDARTKDALDYLENFFNNIKNGTFTEIEQVLAKKFEDALPFLIDVSKDNENPKLDELQFILRESYQNNPETRTLLFVNTRALVLALKKWIDETPELRFLRPEILIGRNRRHDKLGMSLPSQQGALETFRSSGESKLLIATSVADEGIDIPACNLVLLYEYVGNVTKMIQVRGRGRAKDSKCYLITSKREQAERERINVLCEVMMNEAVTLLQKQDKREFIEQSLRFQKEEKKQRDLKKSLKPRVLSPENKRLLCLKCKMFACNTDDIRIIQISHHTVINKDFKDRYFTKPHSNPRGFCGYKKLHKIYCKNPKCGEDWGVSGSYLNFQDIPLIKIDKFVVENADQSQQYFNKWVKVNFTMKEFNSEEILESFSANPE